MFGFPGWTQTTKPPSAQKCLSIPKEVSLGTDNRMRIAPIPEMALLRSQPSSGNDLASGSQIEVRLTCEQSASGAVGMDVLKTPDGTQFTRIAYNFTSKMLLVDQRTCCGASSPNVVQTAPLGLQPGAKVELAVFVDGYIIEVFMNNQTVITAL